jgi:macrolide transport system ATP-binding/permease protein
MFAPLLEIDNVSRIYRTGEVEVRALDGVSLKIHSGEFVAVMGQSGSGKSTLMNILGCLDRPTSGAYRVRGQDVAAMDADELAALRRDTFGFVFQRYNLLSSISALENVEIPAVYAGHSLKEREERAFRLLSDLGLSDRVDHRPNQLSGGQQQRVSIARALMNGAEVILADEPTGALDSQSSKDLLNLLKELNRAGHTIILITHDAEVASNADRIIEIIDGRILSDRLREGAIPAVQAGGLSHADGGRAPNTMTQISEAVKMAFRSLLANLFRTALTLLGVIIGVASVVAMLALGEGSQKSVLQRIEAMGPDLLFVRPGAPGTRFRGSGVATLNLGDVQAIAELESVAYAVPERSSRQTVRSGSVDYSTSVVGTSEDYPQARSRPMEEGVFFSHEDVSRLSAVVVVGTTVAENLFPGGRSAVGEFILVGGAPFQIIGVLAPMGATSFGSDMDDIVLLPVTTGFMRLFGQQYLSSITIKVADVRKINDTEEEVRQLVMGRHGVEDFQLRNTASLLETVQETQNTFTLLLGSVAAISLLVGGIGVMNIMLVSVRERTREIGVRMATGARRSDIMLQFNTEALVVGALGGMIGVLVGLAGAMLFSQAGIAVAITSLPAILAFSCALITGLVFGYLPARQASRMDPVAALATE